MTMKKLLLIIAFIAASVSCFAQKKVYDEAGILLGTVDGDSFTAAETVIIEETDEPAKRTPVEFAWGAGAGASIDMSANDMSAVDFDIYFGMRRTWIQFLGVGAQADIMVSNSCRSYPLFLAFRTGFRNSPTRVFMELKGGVALNYLEHNHRQTGGYAFGGLGVRLASGPHFSSHIVLGYSWIQRKQVIGTEMIHNFTDLHYATVKIGVTF